MCILIKIHSKNQLFLFLELIVFFCIGWYIHWRVVGKINYCFLKLCLSKGVFVNKNYYIYFLLLFLITMDMPSHDADQRISGKKVMGAVGSSMFSGMVYARFKVSSDI